MAARVSEKQSNNEATPPRISADIALLIILLFTFTAGAVAVFRFYSGAKGSVQSRSIDREADALLEKVSRLVRSSVALKVSPESSGHGLGRSGSTPHRLELFGDFDGDANTGSFSACGNKGLEKVVVSVSGEKHASLEADIYRKAGKLFRRVTLTSFLDRASPKPFEASLLDEEGNLSGSWEKGEENPISSGKKTLKLRVILRKGSEARIAVREFLL